MSRTPRTPRTKSGSMRPLGSIHLSQGTIKQHSSKNDPALLINQLHLNSNSTIEFDESKLLLKEKEFQEKEKKLLDQIRSLENIIEQLKQQLKLKSEQCINLQDDIHLQKKNFEEKLTIVEEKSLVLQTDLDQAQLLVTKKDELLQQTTQNYESKIIQIIDDFESKLAALQKSKEDELNERDERMKLMKQRMAASIGKNSQERQQQLEELKRDLIKQAQEARELQQKLKQLQHKSCGNCSKLQEKLEERTLQLRLKEKTISDLQNIGKKMQVQLNEQDYLIQAIEERSEKSNGAK